MTELLNSIQQVKCLEYYQTKMEVQKSKSNANKDALRIEFMNKAFNIINEYGINIKFYQARENENSLNIGSTFECLYKALYDIKNKKPLKEVYEISKASKNDKTAVINGKLSTFDIKFNVNQRDISTFKESDKISKYFLLCYYVNENIEYIILDKNDIENFKNINEYFSLKNEDTMTYAIKTHNILNSHSSMNSSDSIDNVLDFMNTLINE